MQRDLGELEPGGWLIGQYPQTASSYSTTISYATGPLPGTKASATSVVLGDPKDAITAVRSAGLDEPWQIIGDWHAHVIRGSELPSQQDARAWAGSMDWLGRTAYVALVVSPSESQGWMFPRFSAWIAGRDYTRGLPSRRAGANTSE